MKKKLFLVTVIVAVLACLFAFSAYAAEPDTSRETVTLSDGTKCALWDTDGNGLIWYVTDSGYAYISATDPSVDYKGNWTGDVYGVTVYEVGTITINANITSYGVDKMVVVNMMGGVNITSNKCIGSPVNCFSKTFTNSKTLEYAYLPLGTVSFQSEVFKSCSNLKYINFEDLTEFRKIGSQDLNGCSSLFANATLDFTATKLTYVGNNGLANIKATQILLPNTVETLGNSVFENCSNLTSINLPTSITSLTNFNYTFSGCTSLETVTGMASVIENANIKKIGLYAFNNCKALKNVDGLLTNGILIIPEGFTSVDNLCFYECDQIVYVEFPSTINYVGQAAFAFCNELTLVSFDKVDAKIRAAVKNGESYTKVTFNNCGTFKGCSKLLAMSVPEGTTDIINRFVAQGCTSLTAFYMPNTVRFMGTNGGGQGPFCDATSLYFVNEPFTVGQCLVNGQLDVTKLALPQKPTVYYMPTAFCDMENHVETNQWSKDGTIFRNCTSINDVIVFGENFKVVDANNMFQGIATEGSPKTVVFTADVTQFIVTNDGAKYITMVFANEADKTPSDLGITRVRENKNEAQMYFYFCQTGLKYNYGIKTPQITDEAAIKEYISSLATEAVNLHVHDILSDVVTEPTCTLDGGRETFCFCGYSFGKTEVIPMTGHALKEIIDTYYPLQNGAHNYYENRVNLCICQKCADEYEVEIENTALFNKKGYSYSEFDSSAYAFTIYVNTDAVSEYGEALKYGIVVSANVNGAPISIVNGAITHDDKTVVVEFQDTDTDYSIITAKLTNIKAGTSLHLSAYAVENERVSYLGHNSVNAIAETISHEILLEKYIDGKQKEKA